MFPEEMVAVAQRPARFEEEELVGPCITHSLFSENSFKCVLLLYWVLTLVEIMSASHFSWLLTIKNFVTFAALIFAFIGLAIKSATALYLLVLVSVFDIARVSYFLYFVVNELKLSQIHDEYGGKELLPGLNSNGRDRIALILIAIPIGLLFGLALLQTTNFMFIFMFQRTEILQEPLVVQYGRRPPNIVFPFPLNADDDVVQNDQDSPPRYSDIVQDPPSQPASAKEDTSPPHYSGLNNASESATQSSSYSSYITAY